ncbi:MAG TPA: hypothetical protein VKQ72_13620 [Aggregatilineales bacterium]|nr:hypothetical protein [Aggregatilineales bacterium]
MSEDQVKRGLRLVRYGGIVVTITTFVVLLAFAVMIGSASSSTGLALSSFLGYIVLFTVVAAVLSVVVYFAYRAYLMGKKPAAGAGH